MKQTILKTTKVPGVVFLYYFAYATAVVSGVFCFLFLVLLWSNYYAPYSPEKLDAGIAEQMRLDEERKSVENREGEDSEPIALQSKENELAQTGDDEGAESTGQRPDIDPERLNATGVFTEPPRSPFTLLPSDYSEMLQLRGELAADPENQQIRDRIRQLDRQLRIEFFRRKEIAQNGSPFLLIAACVLVFSAKIMSVLNRRIPNPTPKSEDLQRKGDIRFTQFGLFAAFLIGAICFGISVGLLFSERSDLEKFLIAKLHRENTPEEVLQSLGLFPESAVPSEDARLPQTDSSSEKTAISPDAARESGSEQEKEEEKRPDGAFTPEQIRFMETFHKNWPVFRGPEGSGISPAKNIPVNWDLSTGEGLRWKSEIPLSGHSSPVLWENRVFVTGADENHRKIYCFNTEDGALLWEFAVPENETGAPSPEVNEETGYAAPSPATDGERVYAIYANLDLVAVDFKGNLVWSRNLGLPDSNYGYSASLAYYKDRVLVQYDQGDGRKENESKLYAFQAVDGEILWETPRTIMNSWPSPVVRKVEDSYQILTGADPWLIAYDPENGQEIWRCRAYGGGDTAASPIGFGPIVYASNAMPGITAVDARGKGDLSKTEHELWKNTMVRPDACSPVATEKYLYSLGSGPFLQCIEVASGKMIWELEVDDYASFYSSPSMGEGRIYLFDKEEDGPKAYVIDPAKAVLNESGTELQSGREKEMILAVNPMQEPIYASPAFAEGRIYIRSEKTLYCIESPGQ